MFWGVYQYAKERAVEGRREASFWRTAASMYERGLGAAVST